MIDNKAKNVDRRAAIVCSHVAANKLPILLAIKDEPTMPADSGWQFLCGPRDHEDADSPKVWAIFEVLACDPSLTEFIECAPGTVLSRNDTATKWKIQCRRP